MIVFLNTGFTPVRYIKLDSPLIKPSASPQVSYVELRELEKAHISENPLIIGHRATGHAGVENTISAIDAAIAANVDVVEIDVLLTKDSIPIAMHDGYLNRLSGENIAIHERTYKELKEIPLYQNGVSAYTNSLEEIIEHCNGKVKLLIEYKMHGYESESIIDETMEVVKKHAASPQKNIMFQAFDFELVKEMREKHPEYALGYIVNQDALQILQANLNGDDFDFISLHYPLANEAFVNSIKAAQKRVFVWTVNDEISTLDFLNMGADAVITDNPNITTANEAVKNIISKH